LDVRRQNQRAKSSFVTTQQSRLGLRPAESAREVAPAGRTSKACVGACWPNIQDLRGLDEIKEQALAAALSNVLAYEGIGVCESSWGKWV
jgi:hypothetical protein